MISTPNKATKTPSRRCRRLRFFASVEILENELETTKKEEVTLDTWKILESYYNSLDDAVFSELYGWSGLTPWANDYTEEYEINADLDKWMNKGMNLFASLGSYNLSIAAVDENRAKQPIALSITNAKEGDYAFRMDKEWTTDESLPLYLYDAYADVYTNLMQSSYSFHVTKGDCSGRFFINTDKARVPAGDAATTAAGAPFVWTGRGVIGIERLAENAKVEIYTISGQSIITTTASRSLTLHLMPGVYTVKVHQNDTAYTFKSLVH